MDVVPAFVAVDGVKFPLVVDGGHVASAAGAAGASHVSASVSTARAPTRIVADDLLRDIEALAAQVDEFDAAARQGDVPYANVERSAAAAAKRHRLFLELDGVTAHEWLALCEKNFASPLPASSAGSRFVRLCGAMHQLRYRPEVGAAPCLWRAEFAA